jgi:ABC-type multidrug transport system fused ATPase/permease subunit
VFSALDDFTQEFIWNNLIEGCLQHATVIVASSRQVISCTGIVHLSTEGLVGHPQIVSGLLPGSLHTNTPLARYNASNSTKDFFSSSAHSSSHSSAHKSEVCSTASSKPSRYNSYGTTVEEASVSDVSAAVEEYESWSAMAKTDPNRGTEMPLRAGLLISSSIQHTNFLQHLLETNHSLNFSSTSRNPNQSLRHQRVGFSVNAIHEQSCRLSAHASSDRIEKSFLNHSTSPANSSDQEEMLVCSSEAGLIQWISSMKLGKSLYLVLFYYILYQFCRSYSAAFMSWWAEGGHFSEYGFSSQTYQVIIGCIITLMAAARILSDVSVYQSAINGSQRMRKSFCHCILNAPMSFFMSENLGPLVSVLSGDVSVVAEVLIDCFHYAVLYSLLVLGSMILAVSRFVWIVLVSIALAGGCFWLQVLFRSRLKKVSQEFQKANNDVFHSVSDAIEGIKILRTASGTRWALDDLSNVFQIAQIAVVASAKCTIWLNIRSCCLGLFAVFACVLIAHFGISDSKVRKVIINQTNLYIVFLQWAMKAVGLGIYHLGSVERIHSYLRSIPRESREGVPLSKSWPQQGDVELKNLCLKYGPDMPLALDNVSFKLQPASKIGVVGRTGSGKSTLLVALFRLINPCHGDIVVGGQSIINANLDSVREQMSIIPQVSLQSSFALGLTGNHLTLFSAGTHHVLRHSQRKCRPATRLLRCRCARCAGNGGFEREGVGC